MADGDTLEVHQEQIGGWYYMDLLISIKVAWGDGQGWRGSHLGELMETEVFDRAESHHQEFLPVIFFTKRWNLLTSPLGLGALHNYLPYLYQFLTLKMNGIMV